MPNQKPDKKKKKTFWMHTKKRIRNSRDLILCIVLICSCWSNTLDWQWDQMISERKFCCPVQNDLVNDQIFWDNQIIFRPILGQVLSSFFINQHSQSLYNIQSYVVDWEYLFNFFYTDVTHYWAFGCPSAYWYINSEALPITYSVCCVFVELADKLYNP